MHFRCSLVVCPAGCLLVAGKAAAPWCEKAANRLWPKPERFSRQPMHVKVTQVLCFFSAMRPRFASTCECVWRDETQACQHLRISE
jgi:hypothetical protein